jgi:hypothetical protein
MQPNDLGLVSKTSKKKGEKETRTRKKKEKVIQMRHDLELVGTIFGQSG